MQFKYKIRDPRNFIFQDLDFMSLLYDRRSGITHIIADPAPQILGALRTDSLSPEQIEGILQDEYDLQSDNEVDENLVNIITARLEEFVGLGLVEKEISA